MARMAHPTEQDHPKPFFLEQNITCISGTPKHVDGFQPQVEVELETGERHSPNTAEYEVE